MTQGMRRGGARQGRSQAVTLAGVLIAVVGMLILAGALVLPMVLLSAVGGFETGIIADYGATNDPLASFYWAAQPYSSWEARVSNNLVYVNDVQSANVFFWNSTVLEAGVSPSLVVGLFNSSITMGVGLGSGYEEHLVVQTEPSFTPYTVVVEAQFEGGNSTYSLKDGAGADLGSFTVSGGFYLLNVGVSGSANTALGGSISISISGGLDYPTPAGGEDVGFPGHAAELHSAYEYTESHYDPEVGMVWASPVDDTFYIHSDNLLASIAVSEYDPKLAEQLRTAVRTSGVPSGNLFDVLDGKRIHYPVGGAETPTVSSENGNVIKSTVYDYESGVFLDSINYADVSFILAINAWLGGHQEVARYFYDQAERMYDGEGFVDAAFSDPESGSRGEYQTYKLALWLITSKWLGEPIPGDTVERIDETIFGLQAEDGGFHTGYDSGAGPGSSSTNIETTSLIMIAYGYQPIERGITLRDFTVLFGGLMAVGGLLIAGFGKLVI